MIRDNFIKHKFYIITLFSIFIIIDTIAMYLLEGFVSTSMTTFNDFKYNTRKVLF